MSEHPSQQPSNFPRLLIVEDDPDLSEMLVAYFRVQGYDVTSAAWGEDAVRLSQAAPPDLAILDIRLPDIDGYDVCRRLRNQRRTQDVPVIFLTEKRDRVDKLAGLKLGVVDYITKPFDIQELRLRVRNSLRRSTTGPLTNPVTGLAEGNLVNERLRECLSRGDWGLLVVAIENLNSFSEAYGFIAADDVLRAVSLMIYNALRSLGGVNDFIGHLGATEFVLVTHPKDLPGLEERIRGRLEQSLEYFYPLKDRGGAQTNDGRLKVRLGRLAAGEAGIKNLEELKSGLIQQIS